MTQNLSTVASNDKKNGMIYFIDKFIIPKEVINIYTDKMQYNRSFIKKLPGFIADYALFRQTQDDNIELVTIAIWQDQNSLDNAKKLVQDEYMRIGFDPQSFLQELKITMERTQYSAYE